MNFFPKFKTMSRVRRVTDFLYSIFIIIMFWLVFDTQNCSRIYKCVCIHKQSNLFLFMIILCLVSLSRNFQENTIRTPQNRESIYEMF